MSRVRRRIQDAFRSRGERRRPPAKACFVRVARGGAALRAAASTLIAMVAVALLCLPIVRTPVLADDLAVVARALPEVKEGSLADVLATRIDANVNHIHTLPVAGVVEGFQLWTSVTVAQETTLSVSTAWGLFRLLWVLATLAAATFALWQWRRVVPPLNGLHGSRQAAGVFAGLCLIGLSTLQIHAGWSNDPVVAYNAYAWPSLSLSLVYLGLVGRILLTRGRRAFNGIAAGVVGALAALSYELAVGAVAGACAAAALILFLSRGSAPTTKDILRRFTWLLPATALPIVVLLAGVLMREPGEQDYAGAQLRLGPLAVGTWAVGMAGALPAASWLRGDRLLGPPVLSLTNIGIVVLSVAGLLLAARPTLRRAEPASENVEYPPWTNRRAAVLAPVVAVAVYWSFATAVHAVTPKYQDEIALTLGGVYLFYAVGFAVVTLILYVLLLSAARRTTGTGFAVFAIVSLVVPLYQYAFNHQLYKALDTGFRWSETLLAAATDPVDEERRCAALDGLEAANVPPEYRATVATAIEGYDREFGEPFCRSAVLFDVPQGAYPRESTAQRTAFWWLRSRSAVLRVQRTPGSSGAVSVGIPVGNVPCGTPRTVSIAGQDVTLDAARPAALVIVDLPASNESVELPVRVDGAPCRAGDDPRTFHVRIDAPTQVEPP